MTYKEEQKSAKQALKGFPVTRHSENTLNLGIKQYKRDHPHLSGEVTRSEKARRWESIR
jgi:hypothetical protein